MSSGWKGVQNCSKCGGSGYKVKGEKKKSCKLCVKATGYCPDCNNTGIKLNKPGKECKCKKTKEDKDKKDKKEKKDKTEKKAKKEKK